RPAEAQRTLSQGTVYSSLPENAALRARQIQIPPEPLQRKSFFSAPLEHAQTELLPRRRCTQGGGGLPPPLQPVPWVPPKPAPREEPVPAAPPAAPPQPGPAPPPAELVSVPAASPVLPGITFDSDQTELASERPLPQPGAEVEAAPVPSSPASQPATASAAASFLWPLHRTLEGQQLQLLPEA
ncbi:unnamed protein product, partial [Coccothraustes coccothraustes]